MTTFRLDIRLGNAAMNDRYSIADALLAVGQSLVMFSDRTDGTIRDANGNTVGRWTITDDEQPVDNEHARRVEFAESCCGKCGPGLCYVDQALGN